jgi:N-acetylmuramoyl-L-alanine amidase
MRPLNEIIIHCTATRADWWSFKTTQEKVAEVRRWHMDDRGWSDIGYHFLIDRDGTVMEGRPLEKVGAHVKGHNTGTIGISLFGGHGGAANDGFLDNFTEDQERALHTLIRKLQDDYPSITKISGHNQYANKACPTFSVPAWLEGARSVRSKPAVQEQRTSPAQSRTVQASTLQVVTGVSGAVGALQALSGTAQIIALCGAIMVIVLGMFIMRERLKAWASGWR